MRPDWQPSESVVKMAQDETGKHPAWYASALAEFVLFWQTHEAQQGYPKRWERSQSAWDRAFLQTLVFAKTTHPPSPLPKAGQAKRYSIQPANPKPMVVQPASHPSYKSIDDVRREAATTTPADKARDQAALRQLAALAGVNPASLGVSA